MDTLNHAHNLNFGMVKKKCTGNIEDTLHATVKTLFIYLYAIIATNSILDKLNV